MSESSLLYIHCLTGLHPGSGTALGVVDLPVQRERHTQWPIVPGSSLKGVLRSHCSRITSGKDDEHLFAVFGPKTADASAHAGALAISDARMLAFPVRSLRGVFAWVTCRSALSRLQRDLHVFGETGFPEIPDVASNRVSCVDESPLLVDGDRIMLEEFEFERIGRGDQVSKIAEWLARHAVSDHATAERLRSHLSILHDDDFSHFVRHATEVTARVGLDYERKTVRSGALFYEEFLPTETLFYALAMAEDSRRATLPMSADEVLSWLRENTPPIVQIGSGESIGKGICAVRFAPTEGIT